MAKFPEHTIRVNILPKLAKDAVYVKNTGEWVIPDEQFWRVLRMVYDVGVAAGYLEDHLSDG